MNKPRQYSKLGAQALLKAELAILERLQMTLQFEDVTLEEITEQIDADVNRLKVKLANTPFHLIPLRNDLLQKLSVIDNELEFADSITKKELINE